MAGAIRFMFGFYPKTDAIESKFQNLKSEFNKVKGIEASEELSRYVFLQKAVTATEFNERKNTLQNLTYKGSEEHFKEEEYLRLKKMADIKFYYKYKNSSELAEYCKTEKSKELSDYKELKAFIESDAYKTIYAYLSDKKRFEKTPEFKQFKEYQSISGNPVFKNYFKFVSAKGYNEFVTAQQSQELIKFRDLEKYISSPEFANIKNGSKKDFQNSEAFQKYQEYNKTKNSSWYKAYYKMLNSSLYADYKKINKSEELNYFLDLQKTVESEAFKTKKKQIETQKFEDTAEFKKLQQFKALDKSSAITKYFKVAQSKPLAHFRHLEGSKEIEHYENLQSFVLSEEFNTKKVYLLDTKKWEKTEDYKLAAEFEQLKKSEQLNWYFKHKDLPKYAELRAWNLVFEDNFDKGKLDSDKWITRYFWGEMLMGESYALPGEKHLFTDQNLEMNGSTIKLVTRQNKVSGKEWNPLYGFYAKDFDYSSGMISTGKSHRQKYGRVEAKIKITGSQGVFHAFWLAGNTMLPQVDIFKYNNQKLSLSTFWGDATGNNGVNKDVLSLSASPFTKGFFIYSLEWTPDKLVWKINNLVVKTQTVGIPEEPMYVVLNSGKFEEGNASLPTNLEVDWVRCYEKTN